MGAGARKKGDTAAAAAAAAADSAADREIGPEAAARLEKRARMVRPAKAKGKKGKKFADKSFMLSVVDRTNRQEEEKTNQFFEREAELLRRLAQREKSRASKRETKTEKVSKVKTRLQQDKKGAAGPKSKGDHRKTGDDDAVPKSRGSARGSSRGSSRGSARGGEKTKKRVSFKSQ